MANIPNDMWRTTRDWLIAHGYKADAVSCRILLEYIWEHGNELLTVFFTADVHLDALDSLIDYQ